MAQVACRFCGAVGEEDETDLMPQTCPTCFEAQIALMFDPFISPTPEALIANLIRAGCEPTRIRAFVEGQWQAFQERH